MISLSLRNICRPASLSLLAHQLRKVRITHQVKINACFHCQRYCSTFNNNKKDNESIEVYYGALTPQIRGVKAFSLMTSATGVVLQPVLYQQISNYGGGMPLMLTLGTVVGFFTFITPFLLHSITKKYITYIKYNPKDETYQATLITFFLRPEQITFRPEDVVVPDIPGMFTSFNIKGRPVFVDPRLFQDMSHYAKIMGYDKPIDFSMEDISESKQKAEKN